MKKNTNNLCLNLTYLTNFKPNFSKSFYKLNFFKSNKKIFCRNFFLFLFLLKYINNFFLCKNIKFFVKPLKKNFNNILRAPYKNKLSRHQISIFRYIINIKFLFSINIFIFKKLNFLFIFLKNFLIFFNFLETNVIYKNKLKLFFNFKLKNNFNFFNFKKLN